ncbi:MAG: [FeFe] hydrogenase, group A [Spirochaetes bacterium]|nr:[FeFe] hydrogenase, group A [Spirochaetota bacterium]MBU1079540.1 [FeFe] hydrogenase, group A [Spirochaetota bacterium]
MSGFVTIDGIKVPIEGEKNVLALCRKANIDVPTFCYHSKLSTYGACRLCLVEINGKDIDASCVVPPKDGMSVRTSTAKIRSMRRMNLELLLANHKQDCPTCERSASCKLRDLSAKMGIRDVRFKRLRAERPKDSGSVALVRDPNKCILCGDCVRYCAEIQGVGAIDFAGRGSDVMVSPAFGKSLGEVDCVNCGQCAAVCPTAAIVPRSPADAVWKALEDPETVVVAQIAPAVRVAIGERFGMAPGENAAGKIATALRMLGFDKVYDTAFGADLTVVEESGELAGRLASGEKLPLFTSCCPAWVKYAEQFFPELLPSLSSCMSPQAMVGSIVREDAARAAAAAVAAGGAERVGKRVVVVSVMPCVAKKYEVSRPELSRDGGPLVDFSLTTAELASMIEEAGLRFAALPAGSMDMPFGFATGAGMVFGDAGGVAEAVARYVGAPVSPLNGRALEFVDEIPGGGIRSATLRLGDRELTVLSVQGLANAKLVARGVLDGSRRADVVEVMACPGGCVGGAGQPIDPDGSAVAERKRGMRDADGARELRTTGDNPFVPKFYAEVLGGEPGGHRAHELLHTGYSSKKRIQDTRISLVRGGEAQKVAVRVCVGTSCFLRGSQAVLRDVLASVEKAGLQDYVDVSATFCSEKCDKGPTVHVGSETIHKASAEAVMALITPKVGALAAR